VMIELAISLLGQSCYLVFCNEMDSLDLNICQVIDSTRKLRGLLHVVSNVLLWDNGILSESRMPPGQRLFHLIQSCYPD
jgi:hypothetical protein